MFNFPWSNFHELNLDWILSVVKEAKEIFTKGEGDIQHAVETADQALETAQQAAAGVIADGAVTIPKLNSEVYSLFAYCVSGSTAPHFIPAGALVILRKSTIYNVTDGIYTATRNIQQAAIITAADLDQSATLYREGCMNYLLHNEEKLSDTIDLIKAGLVILVTGDEASAAVPADGLVYVVNNTHGLTEGFYFNSSGATFQPTGGTADSNSFTAVNNILNALQTSVATLGSDDIANDSTVTGASVTDALDAVKNTLTQLETTTAQLDQNMAYVESGNTATRNYSGGEFISWKGTLYTANGIISSGQSFSAGSGGNLTAVVGGGLNWDVPIAYTTLTTGVFYGKSNGVVYIRFDGSNTTNLTNATWVSIGTLPAGYRPNSVIYNAIVVSSSANFIGICRVTVDGSLSIFQSTEGDKTGFWGGVIYHI